MAFRFVPFVVTPGELEEILAPFTLFNLFKDRIAKHTKPLRFTMNGFEKRQPYGSVTRRKTTSPDFTA